MGKKNKRDEFDISIEEQLAMLNGVDEIDGLDTDGDLPVNAFVFEDNLELAFLEKTQGKSSDNELLNDLAKMAYDAADVPDELRVAIEESDKVSIHSTEIDIEVEKTGTEVVPKIQLIQAKFSKEKRTICISNNKQMFSVSLDNLPVFINDINNEVEVVNMVRDAVVKKMITCFEPTMMMTVDTFEDNIGTTLDSLGMNVHMYVHDDEDLALLYNISNNFMDEIDDMIEMCIDEGRVFPMFAALAEISGNRYFKCSIDNLLSKKLEDPSEYISYIMAKDDVMFVGADVDCSIEKFKPMDIEDIDDISARAMEIINKIMDKIWISENIGDEIGGE